MIKIEKIQAKGIPLRGDDIDTDRIIPARFLKCITFDGLGEHAFEDDRNEAKDASKVHPFDDSKFSGSGILFVNKNFGCGSSREHAPQALKRSGIKAIVGESFAEIFFGNCISLGIPCLVLNESEVKKLQDSVVENPKAEFKIVLEELALYQGDIKYQLQMSRAVQDQFISGGWDVTGILLGNNDEIEQVAKSLPYLKW